MKKIEKSRMLFGAAIIAAALVCAFVANSVFAAPQAYPGPPAARVSDKILKFRGTVVSANIATIILRNPKNLSQQMGFSFSPAVRDQMVKILNTGGYKYGDKVTVEYASGTTVALKLHGKPSNQKKPPTPQPQKSHT